MSKGAKTAKMPFENTSEVIDSSGDIAAYRGFTPDISMLKPALDSQFEKARRNLSDSYGGYTGIPSAVIRNRLRDEGMTDLEDSRATALAEGNEAAQRLKMAQLEGLAGLTATRKQSGYQTQQQQGGGLVNSLIGGAATVGSALIM
jgi:hypothetical protein